MEWRTLEEHDVRYGHRVCSQQLQGKVRSVLYSVELQRASMALEKRGEHYSALG